MENQIAANFRIVSERVANAAKAAQRSNVRLVAVSKTKPKEAVLAAYAAGARHFGENYVQELVAKAEEVQADCPDIKWHYIGRLQSTNVKKLLRAPHLWAVETVTSTKLADILNSAWEKRSEGDPAPKLNVMVQVNTSGEEQKGGVEVSGVVDLVQYIREKCPNLSFLGLMTIGFAGADSGKENPDFTSLFNCRKEVAHAIGVEDQSLELSMGMSSDYEQAIAQGSTNVRVGSTIFGERQYPKEN